MRFHHVAIASFLSLVMSGCAQSTRASSENQVTNPTPITLREGAQIQPIEFRKIEFGIPRSQIVGTKSQCMGGASISVSTDLTYAGGGDRDKEFNSVFFNELRNARYNIVGNPNSLFEEPERASADYVVAGLIKDLNLRVCADASFIRGTYSSNATITVMWQIFSRLNRKVIFEAETQGFARVEKYDGPDAAIDRSVLDSFATATRGLLANQDFYDLVTGAPVIAEGPSAPGYMPAPLLNIDFVQPATTRFQDQVTDIRAHVATVFAGDGHGSGFFINDGYMLTNQHVVQGATFVKVRTVTGREILGEVLATNAARDIAIVKTEPLGLRGLPLRMEDPPLTSRVFVIGTPLDPALDSSVSTGIVSAFRNENEIRYIQSDVDVQPGNSGGPMFDENGNVIGITVSGLSGLNFFIPISDGIKALGISISKDN